MAGRHVNLLEGNVLVPNIPDTRVNDGKWLDKEVKLPIFHPYGDQLFQMSWSYPV